MKKMANYLNNGDLLKEIVASKMNNNLTPKALQYIRRMIKEIGSEFSYKHKEDKEDCASEAMYNVLKYWNRFDESISTNAFSYFTQCIKNGYGIGYNKLYSKNLKTVSLNMSGTSQVGGGISNL